MKLRDGVFSGSSMAISSSSTAIPSAPSGPDGAKANGMDFVDWKITDVHPGSYDLTARLKFMDELGVTAQIAYPNAIGFGGQSMHPKLITNCAT